jgi:hypothetical protein
MSKQPAAFTPSMSDAAIKAKTGKEWNDWFGVLDQADAANLDHPTIATLLYEKFALPGWWCQCITVNYEQARGKRVRHQTASGFSASVTKTIAASLSDLYAATADAARRKKWFPRGAFAPSSQTRNKYLRGTWKKDARLEIGFYAKGPGKSQIAVQVNKLANRADVERERTAWKAGLSKLQAMLEGERRPRVSRSRD